MIIAMGALAHDSAAAVCRFTGEVIEPCACERSHATAPAMPSINSQSCCELRRVHVVTLDAIANVEHGNIVRLTQAVALVVPTNNVSTAARVIIARQQAPPTTPLYLAHRSLLI